MRHYKVDLTLGGNLPVNFPVIDKLEGGVATSIKSIDLTLPSYTKTNGLFNTLNGYINKLDNFTDKAFSGITVELGRDYQTKALEVAIQPGKTSLSQWEQIGRAYKAAKDKGIDFKLSFIW